jgi:prepilin signal peptidase PulO-like enzyme (type II secretory pathway)
VVELLTGLLFVLVVWVEPVWWLWPLLWVLVSILVVTTVYDIMHLVIPNSLVYTLSMIAVFHVTYNWYVVPDLTELLMTLLAIIGGFGFFAGLWKISAGRWIGFGDAKLAIPLSAMVGLMGTFSMIVLAFWIGTVISLGLILWQKLQQKRGQSLLRNGVPQLTMKSEVPFAPFLIAAFLLVYLLQTDVLALISYVIPNPI